VGPNRRLGRQRRAKSTAAASQIGADGAKSTAATALGSPCSLRRATLEPWQSSSCRAEARERDDLLESEKEEVELRQDAGEDASPIRAGLPGGGYPPAQGCRGGR
jgi:hypothetical protein